MRLHDEDDLLDLLAVLAFDRAAGSTPYQPLRWRINTQRDTLGLEPEKIPTDRLGGRRIERLTIERIA
jgi:hypothetical protein